MIKMSNFRTRNKANKDDKIQRSRNVFECS